jgi:transposase InsO family protein
LYLTVVLDLFNREIVGWSIKPRMTADIVTDALTMAWFRRKPSAGVIFHRALLNFKWVAGHAG